MSLSTQEFYIRQAEETEARGPFTLEQLSSLAENGKVDSSTLYYDAAAEAWQTINTNAALLEALFPVKKSLRVKAKEAPLVHTLNNADENDRKITVNDMLLAAEGLTEETRHRADPAIAQARAAGFGLNAATAILLINAAAYLLPVIDVFMAADFGAILQTPFALLGLLNLVLGVCLTLGAVKVYPWVRFTALLGLGFAGTLFALQDQSYPLALSVAAALGLYFSTILLQLAAVLAAAALGLVGACGLAHYLFTT